MNWNSTLYDQAQNFVSEYGKGLIDLIPLQPQPRILDLGCGTGDLTNALQQRLDARVIGVDASPQMIAQAQKKYPTLDFSVCDATQLPFQSAFDIVFSNAVFHWIADQEALHQAIYQALTPEGLLICEFGADGNIASITQAFSQALAHYGAAYHSPFYFPTADAHAITVCNSGLTIEKIYTYDRPTVLPNGHLGLRQWVCQFFSSALSVYSPQQQEDILTRVETLLRPQLFNGTAWIADYRRLRVIARK